MKLLIVGSRNFNNLKLMISEYTKLTQKYNITEIVSGGAKGADLLGEQIAKLFKLKVIRFLPDWNKYGKKAGILRNIEMGDYCDIALIFWDGKSKGTKHMIDYLKKINKKFILVEFNNDKR